MRWRRSTSRNLLPGISEEEFLRTAREYVASAFPNPDRVGCPGRHRLKALARRELPQDAEWAAVDHVAGCSDCFAEFQGIRKASKRERMTVAGALAGVALATIVVFANLFIRHQVGPPLPHAVNSGATAVEEVPKQLIDLRPFESTRGDSPNGGQQQAHPITLRRGELRLVIQLPIGSEEGPYLIRVLDSSGAPRLEVAGAATLQNYVTTLDTSVDLSQLSPGRFRLVVRRAGRSSMISCPIEVR
jgi:hypothetical protein